MPDNTQPVQQPEERMRTSLPKRWQDSETIELDPAQVGRVQKLTYSQARDFGNMGKQEKFDTLSTILTKKNPKFANLSTEDTNKFVKSLLDHMGELDTYSVKEGLYDVGVPTAGAAVGFLGGGGVGATIGGATAAGIGEVLKMNMERHKRGIPLMTLDEMVKAGAPVAVAEAIFSMGGPLLARLKLGMARRVLLPGGPVKGSIKNLSQDVLDLQEILGSVPVERKGLYSTITDRFRYGKDGPVASLSVQQLNDAEENFVSNVAEVLGSASFSTGTVKSRATEAFTVAKDYMLNIVNQMTHHIEPTKMGKMVRDIVEGKLRLSAGLRDTKWAEARLALTKANQSQGISVPTFEIQKELQGLGFGHGAVLKKEMKTLQKTINDILGVPKGAGMPTAVKGSDALDLWTTLNSLRDNRKVGTAARKLAPVVRKSLFNATNRAGRNDATAALAYDSLTEAAKFQAKHGDTFNNDLIKPLLKNLRDKPSVIDAFIHGGGHRVDNLLALQKAMPLPQFNQYVVPPMRFSFFNDATDIVPKYGRVVGGDAIIKQIKKYGATFKDDGSLADAGTYLKTIFGSQRAVETLHKNAQAMQAAVSGSAGNKILMKIAEATAVMGVATRPIREVGGKAFLIMASPLALSSTVFTNRRLGQELTRAGWGTIGHKPIERSIMTISRMMEQASQYDGAYKWSQEQMNTFSSFFEEKFQKLQNDEGGEPAQ